MLFALKIADVVLALLLIVLVLLQPGSTGLSLNSMTQAAGKFEKRGAEKTLHIATIVVGTLFIAVSVLYFFMAA